MGPKKRFVRISSRIQNIFIASINANRGTPAATVWHRNLFEHIFRKEDSLNNICNYIHNIPARWTLDHGNPDGGRWGKEISLFLRYLWARQFSEETNQFLRT